MKIFVFGFQFHSGLSQWFQVCPNEPIENRLVLVSIIATRRAWDKLLCELSLKTHICVTLMSQCMSFHDDVIKWKHFPRYWHFVRGSHRSSVKSPHKGQWRGALMFIWSAPWINGWVKNREAGDLRRHRAHYDVNCFTLRRRFRAHIMSRYKFPCIVNWRDRMSNLNIFKKTNTFAVG